MNIAICDDDHRDSTNLQNIVRSYLEVNQIEGNVYVFQTGRELAAHDERLHFDIIFMDVFLEKENGIHVIRNMIARREKQISVVFVTTSREYALEAWDLRAEHYLLKPVSFDKVDEAMKRCFRTVGEPVPKMLDVKTASGGRHVVMREIHYIEIFNKTSVIHTQSDSYETPMSLNILSDMLDPELFLRAHRSYIVNMMYIEAFLSDRIVLKNGIEIMLSRSHKAELKKQYQDFLFRLARRGEI